MAIPYMVGSPLFPNSGDSILPNCMVDCAAGDHNAKAGNVVKHLDSPNLGVLQDNVDASEITLRGLVQQMDAYLYATAALITKGDPIIFVRQGAGVDENHWWARTAVGGEAIHGYALETKALNATPSICRIRGPFSAPYQTV